MPIAFVLRAHERGHDRIVSTGEGASYVAGHPESVIIRESSFNFHQYQSGRPGFGKMRVFGDERFSGAGCGYNMHPHHNFVISAIVLEGELTHVNTVGNIDQLRQGDYYVFSAGSGGKHAELSISGADMHAIYLWFLPSELYLPPSYHRAHFDLNGRRNRIEALVGEADGALPIPQDVRISRLISDVPGAHAYRPKSAGHGVYVFVLEGGVACAGETLSRRDSIAFTGGEAVELNTTEDETDMLIIETVL